MTPDFIYFRNKIVIFICIYSSEKEIYQDLPLIDS